jgi:hypothetical protein
MRKLTALILCVAVMTAASAFAGDVLWYYGHNGNDGEGHTDIVALLSAEGAVVDIDNSPVLPALGSYTLIFINTPGFFDPTDFFSAAEKAALASWLTVGSHRVVMVGEWDGFYAGQAVMEDLLAAIGNPIVYVPGAWDSGCAHCSGPLGDPDPLTAGLSHVCYAFTATWQAGIGVPLAYPESPNAPGPYIVSNGTDIPCIVGLGDANIVNDLCGHLNAVTGDADSREFARRLYTVTCAGEELWGCCLPDASCQLLTESDCLQASGLWFNGMLCSDLDCESISTEKSSWSTIKARFQ